MAGNLLAIFIGGVAEKRKRTTYRDKDGNIRSRIASYGQENNIRKREHRENPKREPKHLTCFPGRTNQTHTPGLFLRLFCAYLVRIPHFLDFARHLETCLDTRIPLEIRKNPVWYAQISRKTVHYA